MGGQLQLDESGRYREQSSELQELSAVRSRLDFALEARRSECPQKKMDPDTTCHCALPFAVKSPLLMVALIRTANENGIAPKIKVNRFLPAPVPHY